MARTRRNSPEPASTKSESEESTPPQGGSPTTTARPSQAHVTLFLLAIIGFMLAVGVGSLIRASMMSSRLTQVESQILKTGYTVEAEDAAASNGSDMAQQLRELREQAHNLSIYTNVSRFDANMIHSSLSVDFRERVKNAGDSLASHLQARGIDAGYHVGTMRMITWLAKYGVQNYMVKRVVDLVDFGVDGITPYTKGDSCFQIDALRLAIQFGPEADFDGPEFKEFIALFDECIGTSQAVLRDIGNEANYARFMQESETHPAVLNLRRKVADWRTRYIVKEDSRVE